MIFVKNIEIKSFLSRQLIFATSTFGGLYKKILEQKKQGDVIFPAKNIVSQGLFCSKNNNKSIQKQNHPLYLVVL